jgi:hypothetical protein
VSAGADPTGGRAYGDEWVAVDLDGGGTAFVRPEGGPRITAARQGEWSIEYADFVNGLPRTVRLRASGPPGGRDTSLGIALSQVELNTALDPAAFTVAVPEEARPMTIDELRAAGPLGERAR